MHRLILHPLVVVSDQPPPPHLSRRVCGCVVICTDAIQMGNTARCVPVSRVSPVLLAFSGKTCWFRAGGQFLPARRRLFALLPLYQ
jgi:hypothetical protein